MPKVSDAHKAEVRRRLLDAARTCLERNGYQDVTTRELLAEAGLSNGTLYHYFPTKEHLYGALAEEVLGDDVARLVAEAEGGGMALGLLRFAREMLLGEPEAAAAIATFRARVGPSDVSSATAGGRSAAAASAVERLNRSVVEGFTPLVERAQVEGTVRADLDAAALVELLDIVWDGTGRRAAQATFQTSYERVGSVLLDLLVRGALAPGARDVAP